MPTIERPTIGEVEERQAPELELEGKKIRGRIPYRIESRDLGGWREVIEPTALRNARIDDLVATIDHTGVPIGRYPTTLDVEDRSDGLHWSVVPPESRGDVREAIERGDLRAGSWRMVVGRDEWRGDVRHVHEIAELRDVSVVSHPSYPASEVELRSRTEPTVTEKEDTMSEEKTEERTEEERTEDTTENTEERKLPAGSLRVEDRAAPPIFMKLTDAFLRGGFPASRAAIGWDEYRSLTFGGTIDLLSPIRREGVALGADMRYAYPAFESVAVDSSVTSVSVLRQDSRTLAAGTAVIRDIGGTATKAEVVTSGTVDTVSMRGVAGVETGVPNIYLEQQGFYSLVDQDLRLSLNEGLDQLVGTGLATSGTITAGSADLLTNVRKAITAAQADGYAPNVLLIDPAGAEEVDLFRSSGPELFYVFGAGRFAPGELFGLQVRVTKAAGTAVVDTNAFGKLYASPVSLARFEENAGSTNTSTVRLEGHAAFGVERVNAAVRIMP